MTSMSPRHTVHMKLVKKRAVPTASASAAGDFTVNARGIAETANTIAFADEATDILKIEINLTTGGTPDACQIRATNSNARIKVDAEL